MTHPIIYHYYLNKIKKVHFFISNNLNLYLSTYLIENIINLKNIIENIIINNNYKDKVLRLVVL